MLNISQYLPNGGITVHGTALSWHSQGILLVGPSGCGKSDLALRLMHQGAHLIADDQVIITPLTPDLQLSCPFALQGMIEVFGLGVFSNIPICTSAPLRWIFCKTDTPKRTPRGHSPTLLGHAIPVIELDFTWISTIEKVSFLLKFYKNSLTISV